MCKTYMNVEPKKVLSCGSLERGVCSAQHGNAESPSQVFAKQRSVLLSCVAYYITCNSDVRSGLINTIASLCWHHIACAICSGTTVYNANCMGSRFCRHVPWLSGVQRKASNHMSPLEATHVTNCFLHCRANIPTCCTSTLAPLQPIRMQLWSWLLTNASQRP